MITAELPVDEAERIAELRALRILDTPAEDRFDQIVGLAADLFDVPMAFVSMVDSERQWFKARQGICSTQTDRDVAFCAHAILQDAPLIIPDATADPRFVDNPLVTGKPFIRFYAGFPVRGPGGRKVGTLCIADHKPREVDERELRAMGRLARMVEGQLAMLDVVDAQQRLIETQRDLVRTRERLAEEIEEAGNFIQSLLPERWRGPIFTDWAFIASSQLGGDLFGYHWLDDNRFVVYLFDVCGHGVGAALLSSSIRDTLRNAEELGLPVDDPGALLTALNRMYPMEANGNRFFTIWYGVFDQRSRELQFSSAGHPPAMLFEPEIGETRQVPAADFMIGVEPDHQYATQTLQVGAGARLYIYSDGAYEFHTQDGGILGIDRLAVAICEAACKQGCRVNCVLDAIRSHARDEAFDDDVSIVEVEFA